MQVCDCNAAVLPEVLMKLMTNTAPHSAAFSIKGAHYYISNPSMINGKYTDFIFFYLIHCRHDYYFFS